MLHSSPLLKNTCVRQVALDKWFPLSHAVQDTVRMLTAVPRNQLNALLDLRATNCA